MGALRRRIWLILICLFVFTAGAIGTTWCWLRWAPMYTANALLVVNAPRSTLLGVDRGVGSREVMDRLMMTFAQSVQTDQVFKEAMDKYGIRKTQWYNDAKKRGEFVVDQLREEVSVVPEAKTNLIRISMTGRDRRDITTIVNAVAEAAQMDARTSKSVDREELMKDLMRERDDLRKVHEAASRQIEMLHRRGEAGEAVEAMETLRYQTAALTSQLIKVQSEFVAAQKLLDDMKNRTAEEMPDDPDVQMIMLSDRDLIALSNRELGLQLALAAYQRKVGPEHRMVATTQKELAVVQEELARLRKERLAEAIETVRSHRQQQFLQLEAAYVKLQNHLAENDVKIKTIKANLAVLDRAKNEQTDARRSIEQLQTRLRDERLLMQAEDPLVLHRRAIQPREPSFPQYMTFTGLGVFLGLLVGVGLSLLLEFTSSSIRGPHDVARKLDLPVLGMVPHLDDIEEEIDDLRLVAERTEDTLIDESFRQIRTALMFSGPGEHRRSLLVTSPMPEDGRTMTALNLAHTAAKAGVRVIVIDANFRQPAIRDLVPACPAEGLSSVLQGQCAYRDVLCEIEPNLTVMSTGPSPASPSELLASESMKDLLEKLGEDFDQIIFDGGPCLVVSEPSVLSTMVDGIVLVVRANETSFGMSQRTRDMLQRLGANIFGVVINGMRVRAGGYLRRNYETYYEYRENRQLPVAKS